MDVLDGEDPAYMRYPGGILPVIGAQRRLWPRLKVSPVVSGGCGPQAVSLRQLPRSENLKFENPSS